MLASKAHKIAADDISSSRYRYYHAYGDLGLLTSDGRIILPFEYNEIDLGATVFEKSQPDNNDMYEQAYHQCVFYKNVEKVQRKGAMMMNNSLPCTPCIFHDIKLQRGNGGFCWGIKLNSTGEYEVYNPEKSYVISYRDLGEKYYNQNEFDKVIEFYTKEGINAPWAKFFSASALWSKARSQCTTCEFAISLLNNNCDMKSLSKYFNTYFDLDLAKQCLETAYDLYVEYSNLPDAELKYLSLCRHGCIGEEIAEIEELKVKYSEALAKFEARRSDAMRKAQQEAIRAQEEKIEQQRRFVGLFLGVISNAIPSRSSSRSSIRNSCASNGVSSSSRSSSSSYSSSQTTSTQYRQCNKCRGTGDIFTTSTVGTYGKDEKVRCAVCGQEHWRSTVHHHKKCDNCNGTGKVAK